MALVTYNLTFQGSQEVTATPIVTTASGTGTAVFDTIANTLTYTWNITGLDFGEIDGGAPVTAAPDDDVTGFHFHMQARGQNGGIVFDIPIQDMDDLQIVNNGGNTWTISGIWETSDPANQPITNFAAMLAGGTPGQDISLYGNVHSAEYPNGEIRGQLVTACYLRGTLIRTPDGDVPVEALAIGDHVITASGAARPIKWIGRRAYDPRFVAGNPRVLPVRIEAGALAHGVPARDLFVSPEHALYIRDVLVPAQLLVNDATITQPECTGSVEYFHLELDTHDVILAEGTPAETFVDCDNRFMFQNGREFALLYPLDASPRWEFCAPRMEEGAPELEAIRTTVLARAKVFGRFTDDPDLHLVAGGEIVRPQSVTDDRSYRFLVPAGSRPVAIASRSIVPVKVQHSPSDERRLGVAVERIALRGAGLTIEIGPDCPGLTDGFHEQEAGVRWTDGRGRLPDRLLAPFTGDITIDVHLAETDLRYGIENPPAVPDVTDAGGGRASAPRMRRIP